MLQQVIVCGIERWPIVAGDKDRENFVQRLERLLKETAMGFYAWAQLDMPTY